MTPWEKLIAEMKFGGTVLVCFIVFILFGAGIISHCADPQVPPPAIVHPTDSSIGVTGMSADTKKLYDLVAKLRSENSELLKAIHDQQRSTKEVIDEIGVVKAEIKQTRELGASSTKVYDKPGMEEHHYFYKEITVKNKDGDLSKVAWVMFYPNQPESKRWKFGTFPISAKTTVVETQNRNGTFNRYAEIAISDKYGVKIPVKVDSIEWEKVALKDKKFSWNLRAGISVMVSSNVVSGVNASLASYGKTDVDMDWRFLTFGAETDGQDIYISFEPFSWNVGKVIPVVKNIFVGPAMTLDSSGDIKYTGQISVPF